MGDEVLATQFADAKQVSSSERMVGRQRGDQSVAAKYLHPDRGVLDRWAEQGDVDVTSQEGVQLRGSEHLAADADVDHRGCVPISRTSPTYRTHERKGRGHRVFQIRV